MNKRQLIVLWLGIAIFVLMGLFPPWYGKYHQSKPLAHSFAFILLRPEIHQHGKGWMKINTTQLIIQWSIVTVITSGLVLSFKKRNKTQTKETKL